MCHLRASAGGGARVLGVGFEGRLGRGPDLARGRARVRVAARRSKPSHEKAARGRLRVIDRKGGAVVRGGKHAFGCIGEHTFST